MTSHTLVLSLVSVFLLAYGPQSARQLSSSSVTFSSLHGLTGLWEGLFMVGVALVYVRINIVVPANLN